MNKLKKILLEEGTTLIPFSFVFKNINKYWNKKRDNFKRLGINVLISTAVSIYALSALTIGANPLKPQDYLQKRREVLEQRKVQEEQEARVDSNRQFYEADKNKDSVIDSNEFYNYIKK